MATTQRSWLRNWAPFFLPILWNHLRQFSRFLYYWSNQWRLLQWWCHWLLDNFLSCRLSRPTTNNPDHLCCMYGFCRSSSWLGAYRHVISRPSHEWSQHRMDQLYCPNLSIGDRSGSTKRSPCRLSWLHHLHRICKNLTSKIPKGVLLTSAGCGRLGWV
jgi:hypothetical protein